MEFPDRLVRLRKERGLTQQQLADRAEVHVVQIRRYEGGVSQPAVNVFKRLAVALSVSADALLFDEAERSPDEEFRLQFEALSAMPATEKELARSMLEAIILKNRVAGAVQELSPPAAKTASPPAKMTATSTKRKAHAAAHR